MQSHDENDNFNELISEDSKFDNTAPEVDKTEYLDIIT